MKVVKRNLNQLKVYPNNPRNNLDAVSKVKASIIRYGYKVPIVIDNDDYIVAGHTRYAALLEIHEERGFPFNIDCILADDLTDQEIREFRIVDNSVAQIATWDISSLKLELESLPNFDINDFGGIKELTIEEIQIQEEEKVNISNDKVQIRLGPDVIEITEIEYHEWVSYAIQKYNKTIVDFARERLELDSKDRVYEVIEI